MPTFINYITSRNIFNKNLKYNIFYLFAHAGGSKVKLFIIYFIFSTSICFSLGSYDGFYD